MYNIRSISTNALRLLIKHYIILRWIREGKKVETDHELHFLFSRKTTTNPVLRPKLENPAQQSDR